MPFQITLCYNSQSCFVMSQTLDIDEKLYAGLRRGDEYAYAMIFDKYNRLLYALAYRYFKSGAEAEDAVQHTFMKVWGQRETLEFHAGIRSLLFTILKNYILNELRHRQIVFEKHYEMAQQNAGVEESFLEALENKELKECLWAAINKLPDQKKRICQLKIGQKLSNKEIAEIMHITVPTVKSHYTQAIKMLRNAIEPLIMLLHAVWLYYLNG